MDTKICKVCGDETYNGLYCHEHYKERRRELYATMEPEAKKLRQAKVRECHRRLGADYARKYYYKHHEKVLAQCRVANRKWRAANKDKLVAAVKSWNERHPEKRAEYRERAKMKVRLKREERRRELLDRLD